MKSLVDLCLFCVAENLGKINRVGTFLSRVDKESLLERLCDHDMLTPSKLPLITYHLFAPQLRVVSFTYNDQVTDSVLMSLGECGCKLRRLTLKHCLKIRDKGLGSLLKTQTELEYMEIKACPLTDKGISSIKSWMLSTVVLQGLENVTNNGILMLVKNCPNIHELKLSRCNKLTDAAVQGIVDGLKENLEILDLTNVRLLTDISLMAIGRLRDCPNLRELYLVGCNLITGSGLSMVTDGCPKLSCLDIGYCYRALRHGSSTITEKVFPAVLLELSLTGLQLSDALIISLVKRLTQIRILRLCGLLAVDDIVLESVCSNAGKTITELDLSACGTITDDGLSAVPRHCHFIESLLVSFCPNITGRRLEPLFNDQKRAAEIRVLIANGCKKFSVDVIWHAVTSCPNLETILLAGIKDVDDELLSLMAQKCSKLKNINIKGCGQVTDAGVCELARLCPLEMVVVSGDHSLTDKSVFALTNGCASTLTEVYASACTKITRQAINYLKDCCLRRIFVEHRTPNLDPEQVMALNLDTGEFCRADLLVPNANTMRGPNQSHSDDPEWTQHISTI